MTITVGIDVGSGAVKAVVMECGGEDHRILSSTASRIRRRDTRALR